MEENVLADDILAPEYHQDQDDDGAGGGVEDEGPPFGLECLTFTNGPLLALGSWCIAAGILTLGLWPRDPYVPPSPPPPGRPAVSAQSAQCGVVTTGGTAPEQSPCLIPFVHNGVSYNACATEKIPGVDAPWCYTSHNVSASPMLPCGTWCEDNGHARDSCSCGVCGSRGRCGPTSCPPALAPGTSLTVGGDELWACPASAAMPDPDRQPSWVGSQFGTCVDTCVKQPMRRRLFKELQDQDQGQGSSYAAAVCQDGTSSGYYYAEATTQPQIYVLYLEGSGGVSVSLSLCLSFYLFSNLNLRSLAL
jgi:hypothetical protein